MSLDWSISGVADWESISMMEDNGLEGTKTHALVWATMGIGLPGINAKNAATSKKTKKPMMAEVR